MVRTASFFTEDSADLERQNKDTPVETVFGDRPKAASVFS